MGRRMLHVLRANLGVAGTGAVVAMLALAVSALIGLPPLFMAGLLVALGLTTWAIYRRRTRTLDPRPMRAPGRVVATSSLAALVVVFLAAQAVPYGRDHSNPPVTGEPDWATPQTRELMVRACFDCHSNQVVWPWYSTVAPVSWALAKHVDDGRSRVNYQEWDRPQRKADESWREVENGSMPPAYYTLGGLHGQARLSPAELSALLDGLQDTPGLS